MMALQTHHTLSSIPIFTGIILAFLLRPIEGQKECRHVNCYVNIGTTSSQSAAFQRCRDEGYEPLEIDNEQTAKTISKKYTKFWLNIRANRHPFYSYVDGTTYRVFEGELGEEPPPSEKQCAFIHSSYMRQAVNPNLDHCYKLQYALCQLKNCTNNCIFLTTEQRSWFDSRNECLSKKADLAPVVMADALPSFQGPVWIGLRHRVWYDVDKNEEVLFTNWASLRPESTTNECVVATDDGKWMDVPCENNQEYGILCHSDEPLNDNTIPLIAGAAVGALIFLVLLVLLICCLCKRDKKANDKCCSCSCLPIYCCAKNDKSHDNKQKNLKNNVTSENEKKSRRQSVRDFVNSFKLPAVPERLFKARNRKDNTDQQENYDNRPDNQHIQDNRVSTTSDRYDHVTYLHHDNSSTSTTPLPIRKAPPPPIAKKHKALPPIPRVRNAGQRIMRPISELRLNIMKRLSKSHDAQNNTAQNNADHTGAQQSHNQPEVHYKKPKVYNKNANRFNYDNAALNNQDVNQANQNNQDKYEEYDIKDNEPKFLDKRKFVPIGEVTLKKQQKMLNTPGGTAANGNPPEGSKVRMPPPPNRPAPNLKDVAKKQLPPVPPPKPK